MTTEQARKQLPTFPLTYTSPLTSQRGKKKTKPLKKGNFFFTDSLIAPNYGDYTT